MRRASVRHKAFFLVLLMSVAYPTAANGPILQQKYSTDIAFSTYGNTYISMYPSLNSPAQLAGVQPCTTRDLYQIIRTAQDQYQRYHAFEHIPGTTVRV